MMDDHQSCGAGGKRSKGTKNNTNLGTVNDTAKLTRSDEGFPKDIPNGTDYIKSWLPKLREVKNQGKRDLCWAMASIASFCARLRIHKEIEAPLSVRHIVVGLFENLILKGGALKDFQKLKMFLKDDGAILEEDCKCGEPIFPSESEMLPLCTNKRQPKRTFKVKDLVILEKVNESQLISLVNDGPVAVRLDSNNEFKKFRGDGIYKGPTKKSSNEVEMHMVLCHGYGTINGVHYWDIQNSQGTSWGNGGFGKVIRQVSRNDGEPSLFTLVVYPELLEEYIWE